MASDVSDFWLAREIVLLGCFSENFKLLIFGGLGSQDSPKPTTTTENMEVKLENCK